MSKKLFSDIEIKTLSNNKYVKSVSKRGITYTDEFKTLFIAERNNGKLPVQFFKMLGLMRVFLVMLESGVPAKGGAMLIRNLVI